MIHTEEQANQEDPREGVIQRVINSVNDAREQAEDAINCLKHTKGRVFGYEPEAAEEKEKEPEAEIDLLEQKLHDLHTKLMEINRLSAFLQANI